MYQTGNLINMKRGNKTPSSKGGSKYNVYNNDNIYKHDPNFYKMNKYSEFENSNEEENFKVEFFARNQDAIKWTIIIQALFNTLDIFSEWKGFLYLLLKVFIFIILLHAYFILNDKSKLRHMIKKIRILLEIEIIIRLIETFRVSSEIDLYSFICNLLPGLMLNFGTGSNFSQSIYIYVLEGIVILSFGNQVETQSFFLINFFRNMFSRLFFKTVFGISLLLMLESMVIRFGRENWALLDSFKRSYFHFKDLSEQNNLPIIFINKNKIETILYKNIQADSLYKKVMNEKKKNHIQAKSSNMNLNTTGRLNNKGIK